MIIDVGANLGQSIERFKAAFPAAEIHSFEPSPSTYSDLERNARNYERVHLNNCGLGAEITELTLIENGNSDMSSILPPARLAWGTVTGRTSVPIDTLDHYSQERDLGPITILKTDTQGFDLEVMRGSTELFRCHQIQMVFVEVIFSEMYEGLPGYDEIFSFMRKLGFRLVRLYDFQYQENLAGWCDALFIDPAFKPISYLVPKK